MPSSTDSYFVGIPPKHDTPWLL
jgi:hypothetical protein